ncbi:MAG: type I glutamate--ammonia ligase, partial [Cloacibacillus evryensis]
MVRTIARATASPLSAEALDDESGSGLHFDISIFKNGLRGRWVWGRGRGRDRGILSISQMTLFNTTTNSYLRLGSFEAPRYVSWVGANRAQLLLAKTARDGSSRLVLRSPDPLCNPYIAYALIIEAAMEGILSRSRPGAPADLDLSKAPAELLHQYKSLPDNLGAAVELAEGSQFLKKHLA